MEELVPMTGRGNNILRASSPAGLRGCSSAVSSSDRFRSDRKRIDVVGALYEFASRDRSRSRPQLCPKDDPR